MTFRSPISKATLLLSLIVSTAAFAAPPKRRAVQPGSGTPPASAPSAILTGNVVDSVTGQPVISAQVSSGSRGGLTDDHGQFMMKLTAGANQPIHIERTGYQPLDANVTISADTTQTFRLIPKGTVKVRLTNGNTTELDIDNLEFGYVVPFTGYLKDRKMNLCKTGGESFTPDRNDIKHITTGVQMTDSACCSSASIPAINVELKSGSTTTAGFTDACLGYKVDVIALDHVTDKPVFIHFSDIAELTFP